MSRKSWIGSWRGAFSLDGVYVGEPEDLYNIRAREPEGVMYPIAGIGTKLADVKFLFS